MNQKSRDYQITLVMSKVKFYFYFISYFCSTFKDKYHIVLHNKIPDLKKNTVKTVLLVVLFNIHPPSFFLTVSVHDFLFFPSLFWIYASFLFQIATVYKAFK